MSYHKKHLNTLKSIYLTELFLKYYIKLGKEKMKTALAFSFKIFYTLIGLNLC